MVSTWDSAHQGTMGHPSTWCPWRTPHSGSWGSISSWRSRLGCSADQNKGAQLPQKVTNSSSSKCRTLAQTKSMACKLWLGLTPVCLFPFLITTVRWSHCLLSWQLLTDTPHVGMIKWPACWQADLGQSPHSTDVRPILFLATSGQSLWVCHQTGQVNRRKAVI